MRGGGRICRSLDTSEGRVTSPPCRRQSPAGEGVRNVAGKEESCIGSFPGEGELSSGGEQTLARKNSLSWGLLLSAGMGTVKRSRSSAPLRRSSITEASNLPADPRTGEQQCHTGLLVPHFLVLPIRAEQPAGVRILP